MLARVGTMRTRLAVKWCMWKVGGVLQGHLGSLAEARDSASTTGAYLMVTQGVELLKWPHGSCIAISESS